jgi:hypothetical protein
MTEKIIHFLWLNFNNSSDGVLDETLTFFKNRIEILHPENNGWKIHFIYRWNECLKSIEDVPWLQNLLSNQFVSPAHKSDALRYYYLYTMGGVWIDISTFLVTSLDSLVEENNKGFTTYYMPSDNCASWLIQISSHIFESISAKEYKNKIIPEQKKYIDIKNKDFDFITENYFLISSKGNEVCENVLKQLEMFWNNALPRINSKETNEFELNKLMYDLLQQVYKLDVNHLPYFKLIKLRSTASLANKELNMTILKDYFENGYFFNYLQLYLAIVEYSIKNNGRLEVLPLSDNKKEVINHSKLNTFSKEVCDIDNCNNKQISFSDSNKNIKLLSAAYNRLSKWSDNRENRISWEKTFAGDILDNTEYNPDQILEMLKIMDITQLKYSSYTRGRSKSIERLKELFNKPLRYTSIRRSKSSRGSAQLLPVDE